MISTINRPSRSVGSGAHDAAVTEQISAVAFSTELDWMAFAWRDEALVGMVFGHASQRQAKSALARLLRLPAQFCRFAVDDQANGLPRRARDTIERLRRFAEGEPIDFSGVQLHLDHLTPFGRRVVAECRRISWGHVRTYGQLAAACGKPGAARAVGSVMAKNRFPLIVPCHRVLAAGGALGGYSAPDGLRMKRRLLALEGA